VTGGDYANPDVRRFWQTCCREWGKALSMITNRSDMVSQLGILGKMCSGRLEIAGDGCVL
jgi:hypothetical protein